MPLYCYRCTDAACDHRTEDFRPLAECEVRPLCPRCGAAMGRDLQAEHASVAGDLAPYQSYAVAPMAHEMDDAFVGDDGIWYRRRSDGTLKQLTPGPGFQLDRRTGAIWVTSRQQRRELLKRANLADYTSYG